MKKTRYKNKTYNYEVKSIVISEGYHNRIVEYIKNKPNYTIRRLVEEAIDSFVKGGNHE